MSILCISESHGSMLFRERHTDKGQFGAGKLGSLLRMQSYVIAFLCGCVGGDPDAMGQLHMGLHGNEQ